ncbi:MAG: hypothetical protein M1840_000356 [Geoglossum simile]|nr:MAG: hypothetical protein M1840_000356 [Geoglossum simile]
MQLLFPPPFGASNNPFRTDPPDPYLQYPYNCCGRSDPDLCRGYLKLLGTPQGQPVATWEAGSVQTFSLTGIGNHYGGSCQVGFSVDGGKTFQVATSYEGNCPHRHATESQDFSFTVPADIPTGDVVFAWTWFNREQEFNMNCASIKITGGTEESARAVEYDSANLGFDIPDGCSCTCNKPQPARRPLQRYRRATEPSVQGKRAYSPAVPFKERPGMLIADNGNGCLTPHTTAELRYPNPGPDVVEGDGEYQLELPLPPDKCGYQ